MKQEAHDKQQQLCEGQRDKKILNVLYQSSDLYAPMAGVSMVSLVENNKDIDEINFFLMNDGISEANLSKLKRACDSYGRQLTEVCAKKMVQEIKEEWRVPPFRGSYATYLKLKAIDKLTLESDRILYIDADTIINESLLQFVDICFDEFLMAGCLGISAYQARKVSGLDPNGKWLNSGVVLFNCLQWKQESCEEQIIMHIVNLQKAYCLADEAILNVLFGHKVKWLDIKFNFQSYIDSYGIKHVFNIYRLNDGNFYNQRQVADACEQSVIYHCSGDFLGKPWEKNNEHPFNGLFDKYLALSPWSDFEKVEEKRSLIVSVQRFFHKVLPRNLYACIHKHALGQAWQFRDKAAQKYRIGD